MSAFNVKLFYLNNIPNYYNDYLANSMIVFIGYTIYRFHIYPMYLLLYLAVAYLFILIHQITCSDVSTFPSISERLCMDNNIEIIVNILKNHPGTKNIMLDQKRCISFF